jgi:hypothetical protein
MLALGAWVGCSSGSSANKAAGGDASAGDGAVGDGATGDGAIMTQNLCNNPPDLAARAKFYCPGSMSLDDIAGQCGVMYATTPDAGGLVAACIVAATGGAISQGCASCFGVMVECAQKNCLEECVTNPLGDICLDCRCGDNLPNHVNCYDPTFACSGVARPECGLLEAGTWDGYPTGDAGCAAEGGDAAAD